MLPSLRDRLERENRSFFGPKSFSISRLMDDEAAGQTGNNPISGLHSGLAVTRQQLETIT
jgi:hypothetical protein